VVIALFVFIVSCIALADFNKTHFGPVTNAGVGFSGLLVALSCLTFLFSVSIFF